MKWFGVIVRRSNAINPYAAIVGIPPAEIRDVNATWLGRIVQRRRAPNANMMVTAFRGWPSELTCPMKLENGRTPSRATAKMRREAATTAMLVF